MKTFQVRVTEVEHEQWAEAAWRERKSLNQWIRDTIAAQHKGTMEIPSEIDFDDKGAMENAKKGGRP